MSKYRLVKIVFASHVQYWVEKQHRFLFITWWTQVTDGYFSNEQDAMQHMEDVVSQDYYEYHTKNFKENNLL